MDHFYTRNKFVRVALTLLAMFCFSWTFAEDITAEQAMQLARTFVSGQKSIPGQHNSTGMTPQLTQAKKVSGLYVFNVANNGGFIIVSNDDRTTPILGFSESGNLDPDNMPSNMRAWLQGYADEIAWMQKHDVKPNRLSKAPLSVGSHKTDDIAPMVKTKWNQGSPYNNLCPIYSGSSRSVTGCVATAMAQVMKYHEWPKDETKSIPGYTTSGYKLTLDGLDPVTFDWANMLNVYGTSATAAQKTAVATLMKYCGYSVKMNYGPSSGAYTEDVATALVGYFDYNKTTQYVTRSQYTYANWTDLIYYELEHERPVVYGGQSSGGGHEFVCDGYKYENGTDFFHINWGWGGDSDNYFVLSALDPDIQGIGGSSSTDGFHFGQDAVIGIQPSTGTGTIADIKPNEIDLTLVDAYADPSTVLLGHSVDLVVKVTNNSKDPYEGDIMLYEENDDDILSDVFYIEPGETKECVFTITPTKLGSYSFVPLRNDFYYFEVPPQQYVTFEVVEEIAEVPDGLTVYDGTVTNQQIPAYIYYFDDFARSQFVIPAAEVAEMKGGSINSISFYTNSGSPFTTDSPVDVYMKEVDYTTINAFETKESATMVYQGKLRNVKMSSSRGLMTITLSTPYSYGGGNLLIGIENTTDAGFKNVSFYGTNVEGASISGTNSGSLDNVTPTQQNFLPKTTFTYEGGNITCVKPASFEVSGITTDKATFNWEGDADNYTLEYRKAADKEYTVVTGINATTYTLDNLTQNTTYSARVKTVCGVGDESGYRTLSFTTKYELFSLPYAEGFEDGIGVWTLVNCSANTGVTSISHEGNKSFVFYYNSNPPQYLISPEFEGASAPMEVSFWYRIYSENYPETFQVGYSTTTNDVAAFTWEAEVTATNASDWLQYETEFPAGTKFVAVRYNSNNMYYLFLDDFSFEVNNGFAKPKDLAVEYTGDLTAIVTWTAAEGAVSYDIDVNGTVTEDVSSPYELTDLQLSGTYEVKVRANYGGGNYSAWTAPVTFKTNGCMNTDMCSLIFDVTDSYGDGWNGAAIDIYDYTGGEVGELLASVTNQNLDGQTNSAEAQTYTLNFCNGQELALIWRSGSYDTECSYTITDINGDIVAQDDTELAMAYTINCSVTDCRKPTDFAVSEVGPHSVVLSWTENGPATSWVIAYISENDEQVTYINVDTNPYTLTGLTPETMYAAQVTPECDIEKPSEIIYWTTDIPSPAPYDLQVTPYSITADVTWEGFGDAYNIEWAEKVPYNPSGNALWLQYDDDTYATSIGNATANTWTWGVMYPASMLEGNTYLHKVGVYENSYYTMDSYTVNIYTGGDDAPGTLVGTQTVIPTADGMHEIVLSEPLTIDPTQNLWITVTGYGTYLLNSCQTTEPNNQWVLNNSTWANIGTLASSLAGYGWMIRGFIDNIVPSYEWNTASGIASPYTITGLEAEKDYIVRVNALYEGEDDASQWTYATFTTLAGDVAPFNLETAEVTATTATLSWGGVQDSYNVQYRKAAQISDTFFFDDFENGLDQWTITAGAEATHPNSGIWYTINPVNGLSFESHSGTYCASSWSWNSNTYNADNWLITPQVPLGGTLKFWVRTNTGYPDSYEVLLSTGGNTTEDFTVTLQDMAKAPNNGQWNEVTIDLSAYAGQQGYIAIHHQDYDMNYLCIDDFGVYNMVEAGDWASASADEATLTLTGLTPGTEYEWQVQGNLTEGTTEWSEPATFTTNAFIELADNATDNSDIITDYAGKVADVTLTGRTLYKDGKWNTICLPFDVTIEGSVLEGAIARELTDASISGSTLNLTFDETAVSTLVAGTPYIIRWASGEDIVSPVFNGVTIDANADNSFDSGSGETRVRFLGTYDALSFSDDDNESVLLMGGNNELRYANAKAGLGACRAYFKIGDDSHAARRLTAFHTNLDDETMGIRSIENGPLTKDNDNAWYSLDGRRLVGKPTMKGVYINKGHKITIK